MGPLGGVDRQPSLGDRADLIEGLEEMRVEDLLTIGAIEALDEGILIGLAGLNVAQADPLSRTPLDEGLGDELRAVVDTHPGRAAIKSHELVQHPNDPGAGDGGADLDRKRLSVALVEDREGPEGTAVIERISHEIERPGLIQARRG